MPNQESSERSNREKANEVWKEVWPILLIGFALVLSAGWQANALFDETGAEDISLPILSSFSTVISVMAVVALYVPGFAFLESRLDKAFATAFRSGFSDRGDERGFLSILIGFVIVAFAFAVMFHAVFAEHGFEGASNNAAAVAVTILISVAIVAIGLRTRYQRWLRRQPDELPTADGQENRLSSSVTSGDFLSLIAFTAIFLSVALSVWASQ